MIRYIFDCIQVPVLGSFLGSKNSHHHRYPKFIYPSLQRVIKIKIPLILEMIFTVIYPAKSACEIHRLFFEIQYPHYYFGVVHRRLSRLCLAITLIGLVLLFSIKEKVFICFYNFSESQENRPSLILAGMI